MSEIETFFRHCPSCGRRFHIRLVDKHLVREETIAEKETGSEAAMDSSLIPVVSQVTVLQEGGPIYVDVKEFQYTYRCKHCGHQWSEEHEETKSFHESK